MSERLTQREALAITRDMWRWIADNVSTLDASSGDGVKAQWPGLHDLPAMPYNCACCAYADTEEGIDCQACPLKSIFPVSHKLPVALNYMACVDYTTPYASFSEAIDHGDMQACVRHAKVIADVASDLLENLSEEEGAKTYEPQV